MRHDGRAPDELRPIEIIRGFTEAPAGSVLIRAGRTHVLCTASIAPDVPAWRESSGRGWVTAEYEMLPGSTPERKARSRHRLDGRTQEIQRLIGRSLRLVIDMQRMGPRTIHLDCDVLQADGGTRTAAISGAYVALRDAVRAGCARRLWDEAIVTTQVAAVSVGIVKGEVLADLDYEEDSAAEVDCNLVMTGRGEWIEVQGTGEGVSYTDEQLQAMMRLGRGGIERLLERQRDVLAQAGPDGATRV